MNKIVSLVGLVVLSFAALISSAYAQITVPLSECPFSPTLPQSCWLVGAGSWICTRTDLSIALFISGTQITVLGTSDMLENCAGCPEHTPSDAILFAMGLKVNYTEPTPTVSLACNPMQNSSTITTNLQNSIGHPPPNRSISLNKNCGTIVPGCKKLMCVATMDVDVMITKRMPHDYSCTHNNITHGAIVFRPPPLTGICSQCGENVTSAFPRTYSTPTSRIYSTVTGSSYSGVGQCTYPSSFDCQ